MVKIQVQVRFDDSMLDEDGQYDATKDFDLIASGTGCEHGLIAYFDEYAQATFDVPEIRSLGFYGLVDMCPLYVAEIVG